MEQFAWMAPQPATILRQGEVAAKKRRGKALFNTSLPVLELQASSGLAGSDAAHARAKTTAATRDEHLRAKSCEPDFLPQVLPPTPPFDADAPPELRAPTPTHGKAAMQVARSWENRFIRSDPDKYPHATVAEAERKATLGIVCTNPDTLSRESASLIMQRLNVKLIHQTERSAALAREIEGLQEERAHWKATAKSKHDHLKSSQKRLKEAHNSLESAAGTRKELADALADMREKKGTLETKLAVAEKNLAESRQAHEACSRQLADAASRLTAAEEQGVSKDAEIARVTGELELEQDRRRELERAHEAWVIEREQLSSAIAAAREGLASAKIKPHTADAALDPIPLTDGELLKGNKQAPEPEPEQPEGKEPPASAAILEKVATQISSKGAVNSDLTALKDKLANKQKEMADELDRSKRMLVLADKEKKELNAKLDESRQQTQVVKQELAATGAELQARQHDVAQLQEAAAEMQQELQVARVAQAKLAETEASLKEAKQSCRALEGKVARLEQEVQAVNLVVETQSKKIKDLSAKDANVQDVKNALAAATTALEQEKRQHAECQKTADKAHEEVDRLALEVQKKEDQVGMLRDKFKSEQEENAALNEALDELRSELETKKARLKAVECGDRSELEVLLLGEMHKKQMAHDAVKRKTAAQLKELQANCDQYQTVAVKSSTEADAAVKTLKRLQRELAAAKVEAEQRSAALQTSETERNRLSEQQERMTMDLLETTSERDRMRLQLEKSAGHESQMSLLEQQLAHERKERKKDVKEIELLTQTVKRLQDLEAHEQNMLNSVRKILVASRALEGNLTCLVCTELMSDAVVLQPCGHSICKRCWDGKRHDKIRTCPEADCRKSQAATGAVGNRITEQLCANLEFQLQVLESLANWSEKTEQDVAEYEAFIQGKAEAGSHRSSSQSQRSLC